MMMMKYRRALPLFALSIALVFGTSTAFLTPSNHQHHASTASVRKHRQPPTPTREETFVGLPQQHARHIGRAFTSARHSPLFARKKALAAAKQKSIFHKIVPAVGSVVSAVFTALAELTKLQKLLFASVFLCGIWLGRIPPFWKEYRDVQEIPMRYYGADAPTLTGRAVSVSDGDTIRFYHTPLPWQTPPTKMKVSEVALPIRLCTMDTPETPKFGKPGQPFGLEAKQTLKDFLGDGPIKIRLLQKDQYGRAVAQVMKGGKHADEFMLKQGMAEVYTGGGAVYGPKGLDAYLEIEKAAKKKKLGIWSSGKRESAAEYKKRTKE